MEQELEFWKDGMTKEEKELQDRITVTKYRERLKAERMPYMQKAVGRAENNRRARALALGEAALKAMDGVRECSKGHRLIPNTLEYMIEESVIYPIVGVKHKQFEYNVMWQVLADEPLYTNEEIEKECDELRRKLEMETEELYAETAELTQ